MSVSKELWSAKVKECDNFQELYVDAMRQKDFFHQEFHKTLQHAADDTEEYEKQIKELTEENEKLNDDDWVIDCHKALKYKIVLTEDYWAELKDQIEELGGRVEQYSKDADQHLKVEIEHDQLKRKVVRQARFWQCLMDCIDNPDNPCLNEVDDWCKAYKISDKIREELYEDFNED